MNRFLMPTVAALIVIVQLLVFATPYPVTGQSNPIVEISSRSANVEFPDGVRMLVAGNSTAPVDRAELYFRIADYPVEKLAVPERDLGTSFSIDYLIDLRIDYIAPGVDIVYRWRFVYEDGSVFETNEETVLWFDNRFDWESISSGDLSVYAYTGGGEFLDRVLEVGVAALEELKQQYGIDSLVPIRLWLYENPDDFEAARAENSREFVPATAFVLYQLIIAVVSPESDYELGRIVPHELSHHVLYQATRNPYNNPPIWMDEGLAVNAQVAGNEDGIEQAANAEADGSLPSVRSLVSEFPYEPDQRKLAYASSFSIVRFIESSWGNEGMTSLISAYAQGMTHDDALMQSLGVTYEELDFAWREWLRTQG